MNPRSLAISRSALLVGLTVAIFVLLPFPILGLAASLLLPIPLILLGVSHGAKYLWMGILGVMLIISMVYGPLSLFLYLPLGACSLALGWGFSKKLSLGKVMLLGWLAVGSAGLADYTIGSSLAGINPQEEISKWEKAAAKQNVPIKTKFALTDSIAHWVIDYVTENHVDMLIVDYPKLSMTESTLYDDIINTIHHKAKCHVLTTKP